MSLRPLLAAVLILLGPGVHVAHAQAFGVKAGVTRAAIVFDHDPAPLDVVARPGWLVGGWLTIPVAGRVAVQGEALFVERRAEFEEAFLDRLRYIEFPVTARYRLFSRGSTRLVVEGGAHLAVLLDAREDFNGESADISEAIEPREVAALAGVAVEWRTRWTFGVRYLHGLSDTYSATLFSARQRGVQITAAVRVR